MTSWSPRPPRAHTPENLCLLCVLSQAQFSWLVFLPEPPLGQSVPLGELQGVPLPQDPVLI